jgi:peptidoglycan/xylan/chitin deacetylase (PgdA/CDA1 family)
LTTGLRTIARLRDALPPSARQTVRRAIDPILAPVGSVAGVHPAASGTASVALTFDDGPDPEVTPAVLDALATDGARATFFVLVDRAVAHPELVRRVAAEGHEIALHGADHRRLTTLDPGQVRSGIDRARRDLESLVGPGVGIRWFRPPFGSQNLRSYAAARRAGMVPVMWTAEGEDWVDQPVAAVADRVVERLRPGGIVLLHDGLAGDPREPETPDPLHDVRGGIVTEVLHRLAAGGLAPTTVGDLVDRGRVRRTAWFRP